MGYLNSSVIGTIDTAVPYLASYFGLNCKSYLSLANIKSELIQGRFVLAALGYNIPLSPWGGTTTHEVLIRGYDVTTGNVYVYDPYDSSNNGQYSLNYLWNTQSYDAGDRMCGTPFFSIY